MTQLKRLLDEPGSDLDRVLLEAGLDEEPPKAALDRTLVALGVGSATAIGAGAIGAGGAGASLGGAKSLFGAGMMKWVGGALLASATIGGGYFMSQRPPEKPQAAVQAPATTESLEERTPSAEGRSTPVFGAEAAPQRQAVETVPAAPAGDQAPAKADASAPLAKLDAKAVEANSPAAKGPAAKASEPQAKAQKQDVASSKPQKAQPDLTAGGGSLSDELRMLDTARKALLAGDNDACLANLSKYTSKFPKGQLVSDAQAMKASCAAKKAAAAP